MVYLYQPFPDETTRVRVLQDISDQTVMIEYLDDLYQDVGVQEEVPRAHIREIQDIPDGCQKIGTLNTPNVISDRIIQVARQHVELIHQNEGIMRILRDYVSYNQRAYLQHIAWGTIETTHLPCLLRSLTELYAFIQTLPPLPEDLWVHRGVNVRDHQPITQLGYMPHFYLLSTSFKSEEAEKFSDASLVCCHLRIRIPARYPCIFLSIPGINSGYNISGNDEVVLLPCVLRLSACHNFQESMHLEMVPHELNLHVVQNVYKKCTQSELQQCLVSSSEYGL